MYAHSLAPRRQQRLPELQQPRRRLLRCSPVGRGATSTAELALQPSLRCSRACPRNVAAPLRGGISLLPTAAVEAVHADVDACAMSRCTTRARARGGRRRCPRGRRRGCRRCPRGRRRCPRRALWPASGEHGGVRVLRPGTSIAGLSCDGSSCPRVPAHRRARLRHQGVGGGDGRP